MVPYALLTIIGLIGQGVGWDLQWRYKRFHLFGLIVASAGLGVCILGFAVIREGIRMGSIDLTDLANRHRDAAAIGGFSVFLISVGIAVLEMAWCVRLVQKGFIDEP